MEKDRSIDRLIFFTDAVVAIAITVLILPLVDIVTGDGAKSDSVAHFIGANVGQLFAFALSFVIIARFWISNHIVLADTVTATPVLMWLDIGWVFTIVVLPLPTEITAVFDASVLTTSIYIGTCFASTLLLTAMSVYLYRHPRLERKGKSVSTVQIWGIGSSAAGTGIALILAIAIPSIHYYALLVLLLATPLDFIIKPRLRAREAAKAREAARAPK